jgi:hypothetical protein
MILKQNNFDGIDMFREWKREDCQNKLWNGVHQEEENEVDQNLPGRKTLEDWRKKRDWWKKTGMTDANRGRIYYNCQWSQEDVETLYNLLNNNNNIKAKERVNNGKESFSSTVHSNCSGFTPFHVWWIVLFKQQIRQSSAVRPRTPTWTRK